MLALRGECPALEKKCDFCKKTGHLANDNGARWQPDTSALKDIMNERHLREYEKEVGIKVILSHLQSNCSRVAEVDVSTQLINFKRYCALAKKAWTLPSLSQWKYHDTRSHRKRH